MVPHNSLQRKKKLDHVGLVSELLSVHALVKPVLEWYSRGHRIRNKLVRKPG